MLDSSETPPAERVASGGPPPEGGSSPENSNYFCCRVQRSVFRKTMKLLVVSFRAKREIFWAYPQKLDFSLWSK